MFKDGMGLPQHTALSCLLIITSFCICSRCALGERLSSQGTVPFVYPKQGSIGLPSAGLFLHYLLVFCDVTGTSL